MEQDDETFFEMTQISEPVTSTPVQPKGQKRKNKVPKNIISPYSPSKSIHFLVIRSEKSESEQQHTKLCTCEAGPQRDRHSDRHFHRERFLPRKINASRKC